MKCPLFLTPLLFVGNLSKAQMAGNISELNIYKDTVVILEKKGDVALNLPGYKFLFKNQIGKVYESPVDRMRCLAPDFSATMPLAGKNIMPNKPEPMPNGLKDKGIPIPLLEKK